MTLKIFHTRYIMSKFNDDPKEPILIRLVNNDRIVGLLLDYNEEHVALYAPMQILAHEYSNKNSFVPYDTLSATPMAIFDHGHVLTITVPKAEIIARHAEIWQNHYPTYKEMKAELLERHKESLRIAEEFLDPERVKDMFEELIKRQPLDKKNFH